MMGVNWLYLFHLISCSFFFSSDGYKNIFISVIIEKRCLLDYGYRNKAFKL